MINLLPLEQKREIKREEIFKIFWIFSISILLFLIFLILSLKILELPIFLEAQKLNSEISYLKNSKEMMKKEIETVENLKKILPKIINFQREKKDFLIQILEIRKSWFEGIEVYSFSIDSNGVSISGKAAERSQLLRLKENLEQNKNFSNITFSGESWLKEKDAPFWVKFSIRSWISEKK